MSNQIHILDEKTINQIAAGEVIENPSSCVKELVENAIDAKAGQIEVHIVAGGRKKIEIVDNGSGMSFDDALLSLERHATSKIRTITDMDTIHSMGFRGEALASIAAISRFELHTSDGKEASKVVCHGGKIIDQTVSSRTQGTTISISSLFYNVPARKEFQKSISYDTREITRIVTNLALAYPKINFKLVQDHQEVFNLLPKAALDELENLKLRIQQLFGAQLHNELVAIDSEKEGLKLTGFVAKAKMHRPNRLGQHLFVNRRFVDSRFISMAVREGYSTRLAEGKFPLFFLSMELDPQKIDVNVHPQKKEIRFKEPFEVKRIISTLIDKALQEAASPQTITNSAVKKEVFFQNDDFHRYPSYVDQVQEVQVLKQVAPSFFPEPSLDFIPNIVGIFNAFIFVDAKSVTSKISLKAIEQEGMLMVHQKRAQERILFDALVQKSSKISVQNLLLAETLEFSDVDSQVIEEYLQTFNSLGVSLRLIGKNSFMLDGLPSMVPASVAKNLIESVLEEVQLGSSKSPLEEQKKQILASAISKSIPWQNIEDFDQASILITKLFKCENFEYSPKGRPIVLPLTLSELSKKFR